MSWSIQCNSWIAAASQTLEVQHIYPHFRKNMFTHPPSSCLSTVSIMLCTDRFWTIVFISALLLSSFNISSLNRLSIIIKYFIFYNLGTQCQPKWIVGHMQYKKINTSCGWFNILLISLYHWKNKSLISYQFRLKLVKPVSSDKVGYFPKWDFRFILLK